VATSEEEMAGGRRTVGSMAHRRGVEYGTSFQFLKR
jgi:hypothetical protein